MSNVTNINMEHFEISDIIDDLGNKIKNNSEKYEIKNDLSDLKNDFLHIYFNHVSGISFNGGKKDKKEILYQIATLFPSEFYENLEIKTKEKESLYEMIACSLYEREKIGSTGIGKGVAIPHGRFNTKKFHMPIVVLDEAVEYKSVDKNPVKYFFPIIFPNSGTENVSKMRVIYIAYISRQVKDENFIRIVGESKDINELYNRFFEKKNCCKLEKNEIVYDYRKQ